MDKLKAKVKNLIVISVITPVLLVVFVAKYYGVGQLDNIICVAIILIATILSIGLRVLKYIGSIDNK